MRSQVGQNCLLERDITAKGTECCGSLRGDIAFDAKLGVDETSELCRRLWADRTRDFATFLEKNQCRNSSHREFVLHRSVLIHVNLHKIHFACILATDFLESWHEGFTWTAPLGPKVEKNRKLVRNNVFFKADVRDTLQVAHWIPLSVRC